MMKREGFSKNKVGQREYLNNSETTDLTSKLYSYFESMVEIPRMKHGRRQTIETLINEEAFILAQYLRDEQEAWIPRIARARVSKGFFIIKTSGAHVSGGNERAFERGEK